MDMIDLPGVEIDPNFEPQIRARSNTWPLRPREFTKEDDANRSTPNSLEGEPTSSAENGAAPMPGSKADQFGLHTPGKKTTSRRNAWGNLSYADLITKAIENSPEKRLTLSQIYDWMVQNVPYFKDKGDSNSSAGWKNSIRHNLSLHSRFMRVQNEGTGKSSWWVINPDAKPGKTPRRRAASMDTKEYAKKRGRVKKKVEALRAAAAEGHLSPQANSDFGDELDQFSLSPQDRARTSSNASSIGRLSPIQSLYEPDLHDNQVPPMSPIPPWSTQAVRHSFGNQIDVSVSENLAELFLGDKMSSNSPMDETSVNTTMSAPGSIAPQLSPAQGPYQLGPPPPYPEPLRLSPQLQHSPQQNKKHDVSLSESMSNKGLNNSIGVVMGSGLVGSSNSSISNSLNNSLGISPGSHQSPRHQYNPQTLVDLLRGESPPPPPMPPSQPSTQQPTVGENSGRAYRHNSILKGLQHTGSLRPGLTQEQQQALLVGINQTLLRMGSMINKPQQLQQLLSLRHHLQQAQQERLSNGVEEQQQDPRQQQLNLQAAIRQLRQYQFLQQQQQQHQQMQEFLQVQQLQVSSSTMDEDCDQANGPTSVSLGVQPSSMSAGTSLSPASASAHATTDGELSEPMPNDLDLMSMSDFDPGELDCDVDQIIKDELSFGDMLDFNFDPNAQQSV